MCSKEDPFFSIGSQSRQEIQLQRRVEPQLGLVYRDVLRAAHRCAGENKDELRDTGVDQDADTTMTTALAPRSNGTPLREGLMDQLRDIEANMGWPHPGARSAFCQHGFALIATYKLNADRMIELPGEKPLSAPLLLIRLAVAGFPYAHAVDNATPVTGTEEFVVSLTSYLTCEEAQVRAGWSGLAKELMPQHVGIERVTGACTDGCPIRN